MYERIDANAATDVSYRVEVSYMEIYNEKVQDLLASAPPGIQFNSDVKISAIYQQYIGNISAIFNIFVFRFARCC